MKKPVKKPKIVEDVVAALLKRVDGAWSEITTLDHTVNSLSSLVNQLVDKEMNAFLKEELNKPDPMLDWAAELEKFIPLAKALNENPRPEVRPEKPFCVIANTARYAHGGAQGRTWCATRKIAEGHAESLMRNHPGMYDEMFVVEVVSKVAKKSPELEVTRY